MYLPKIQVGKTPKGLKTFRSPFYFPEVKIGLAQAALPLSSMTFTQ